MRHPIVTTFLALAMIGALVCCESETSRAASTLTGRVQIDGSSTVYPITEAVAEAFGAVHGDVRVEVGVSGTGGGFKKFCDGRISINDASRPIKDEERQACVANKVEFIELPVAYDGLTVVVNKTNTFADHLTVAELKRIWEPGSTIQNWSQVREGWPDLAMKLYGPGTDSGTFDYFTEVINGSSGACRADFTASENDNVLVTGVAGDQGALGFFGFAYYANNREKLTAVKIESGSGDLVAPTVQAINDGSYEPLSRPIFIYVSKSAAARGVVKTFVEFYLAQAPELVAEAGYVKLPDPVYAAVRERFAAGTVGSVFDREGASRKPLLELYRN